MVMRVVCLVMLLAGPALGLCHQKGAPQESFEKNHLPKWRLEVDPLGYSSTLSIHRAVGGNTDLGFGFSGFIKGAESRRDEERTDYHDELDTYVRKEEKDDINFTFYLDLRKWNEVSSRVSWFSGIQAAYSFSNSDHTYYREDTSDSFTGGISEERSEWNTNTISGSLILGFDVDLMRHISLGASLTPLGLEHEWNESVSEDEDEFLDGGGLERIREGDGSSTKLRWSSAVVSYLTIYF